MGGGDLVDERDERDATLSNDGSFFSFSFWTSSRLRFFDVFLDGSASGRKMRAAARTSRRLVAPSRMIALEICLDDDAFSLCCAIVTFI